ncbi:hypothetical protein I4U23_026572 [Adineta vaga]|nr:hypothetical protein I4U23_026572 [Adineta vaga]
MAFNAKVHVDYMYSNQMKPIRKSTCSTILSSTAFKVLAVFLILSMVVATIVVPIVLFQRSNKKPSTSSTSNVTSDTTSVVTTTSSSTATTSTVKLTLTTSSTTSTLTTTTSKVPTTTIITTTSTIVSSTTTTTPFIEESNTSITIDSVDTSETFSVMFETTATVYPELNDTGTIMVNATTELYTNDTDNTFTGMDLSTTTKTTTTTVTTTTTTMVPPNLLVNPGAESGNIGGWTQLGPAAAIVDSGGSFNKGYYPKSGTYCFAGGRGSNGDISTLSQNVRLLGGIQGFTEAQLDSGRLKAFVQFYYQTWDHPLMRHDEVEVIIIFRSLTHTDIQTTSSGGRACKTNPGWCEYRNEIPLPKGTRSIDYLMRFTRKDIGGSSIDSYTDDNLLKVIPV